MKWDARGCTNDERLLLWTTAAAVPAETVHSNCGWWQQTAAVEWDVTGHTNGEWASIVDNGGGGASRGSEGGGSGQQLRAMAVAGDEWLWTSSPQLAKMADGCVNRNMTNMRKFGFSEYVCETEKIR